MSDYRGPFLDLFNMMPSPDEEAVFVSLFGEEAERYSWGTYPKYRPRNAKGYKRLQSKIGRARERVWLKARSLIYRTFWASNIPVPTNLRTTFDCWLGQTAASVYINHRLRERSFVEMIFPVTKV